MSKEEDSKTSLGTLTVKKGFSLCFHVLYINLCPSPLVFLLGTTENCLAPSSLPPPHQALSAYLHMRELSNFLIIFVSLTLDGKIFCIVFLRLLRT